MTDRIRELPTTSSLVAQAGRELELGHPASAIARALIAVAVELRNIRTTLDAVALAESEQADLEQFTSDEVAAMTLEVLETYRRQEGIEEWDEADTRCALYNEAWRQLGDEQANAIIGAMNS
jgi:hypothetical protein